jgi:predicted anti-sigma-YlaC factor YlaD
MKGFSRTPTKQSVNSESSCEAIQIAFDQQLHGAVPPLSELSLKTHLAGCEACRRYVASAVETEMLMKTAASDGEQTVDWEALRRTVDRMRLGFTRELKLGVGLMGCLLVGSITLGGMRTWGHALAAVVVGALAVFASVVVQRDAIERMLASATSAQSFHDAYRGHLVTAARKLPWFIALMGFLTTFMLWQAVSQWATRDASQRALDLLIAAALAAQLFQGLRQQRCVAKELSSFDGVR